MRTKCPVQKRDAYQKHPMLGEIEMENSDAGPPRTALGIMCFRPESVMKMDDIDLDEQTVDSHELRSCFMAA